MKRIGILGGTFNPIHNGHLAIAQMVLEKYRLEKVIFVPSYTPPHKESKNLSPAKARYQMVRLATHDNPQFEVSDFEIKKKGKSYSIDTALYLHSVFPKNTRFYFIIGSDMLSSLHTWRCIDELLKLVSFVAVSRRGVSPVAPKVKAQLTQMVDLGISSTALRGRIARGKTVKYLLPDNVIKYIKRNKLYFSQ